jgi:hypothetical protein
LGAAIADQATATQMTRLRGEAAPIERVRPPQLLTDFNGSFRGRSSKSRAESRPRDLQGFCQIGGIKTAR